MHNSYFVVSLLCIAATFLHSHFPNIFSLFINTLALDSFLQLSSHDFQQPFLVSQSVSCRFSTISTTLITNKTNSNKYLFNTVRSFV